MAGHGENLASLLARKARCDKCAGSACGFNNDDADCKYSVQMEGVPELDPVIVVEKKV